MTGQGSESVAILDAQGLHPRAASIYPEAVRTKLLNGAATGSLGPFEFFGA
jgi:hypothetical protein